MFFLSFYSLFFFLEEIQNKNNYRLVKKHKTVNFLNSVNVNSHFAPSFNEKPLTEKRAVQTQRVYYM